MIGLVAALVAFSCSAASARRMWLVSNATAWDPALVAAALGREPSAEAIAGLREAAKADEHAEWERDFLAALEEPDEEIRVALVNEQLSELDYRISQWASVPRICARITTSFAFLLAALVLRNALAEATDFSEQAMRTVVSDGLTVVFTGFVGTTFCIAANRQARIAAKARQEAADTLVERLEAARDGSGGRGGGGPHDRFTDQGGG